MYYYKKLRRIAIDFYKGQFLKRFYKKENSPVNFTEKYVIYMCDGRIHHGGLADRLSGLVSTYDYCKQNNKVFKANYIYPYPLTAFLIPNKYDWEINERDISYNSKESKPIFITHRFNIWEQQGLANKLLNSDKEQIHVYTNMKYFFQCNFKYLFDELFKPSKLLQEAINAELKKLPDEYVSVTFRFQQLLGDLEEGNFPKLKTEKEKELLIQKCLKYIEKIHNRHPEIRKLLVTSDSTTFLNKANKIQYVHTIAGKIVHMDFDGYNSTADIHLKSFVDLFMIAKASTIYNVILPPLYHTSFPWVASMIYGNKYIEI